jgi:hypothetical protein
MTGAETKILGEIFSRISQNTYEQLGEEFKSEKEKKLELDKKFSSDLSIEERAKLDNKYIDVTEKEKILDVISCLKDPKYSFIKDDVDKLTTFISKLNFILRGTSPSGKGMADRMNNIKNELIKDGKSLELDVLFNEFKKATSWKLFKADTSIDSAFFSKNDEWKYVYLFSNCKNCQDKINYPLYYAAWQVIADWCFNVKAGDYDDFCEYYRKLDFLGIEKQLNFSCFYELLRHKLRNDLNFTNWLGTFEEKKRNKILEEIRETELKDNEGTPIDENNIEEQIMDIKEKFKEWLDSRTDLAPNTIYQYKSQIETVNDISENNQLGNIFSWSNEDWESKQGLLLEIPQMFANSKKANPQGSGVYSASLSKLKEFFTLNKIQKKSNQVKGPTNAPNISFNEFCWYWASTGVSEWLNDPLYLFVVCKAIEENGNGNPTYTGTNAFKDIVKRIAISNNVDLTTADQLARTTNPPDKNILENSNSYWFNLDLVLTSPNPATLSIDTLISLTDFFSFNELLKERIKNYKLPNYAILHSGRSNAEVETRIKGWSNNKEFIFPFQILAIIFKALELEDTSQRYLTNDELCRIIIPLSVVQTDCDTYITNILRFRVNPSDFVSWPKPQDYVNNGDRMANEYLLFLEMMGFLTSNKPRGTHKAADKIYQLATSDSLDFILSENKSSSVPPKSTNDSGCKSEKNPNYTENKIYFGAPGTGKSYEISKILKQRIPDKQCRDKFVFRVTFHPEYDHASFLGGYKPYSKDGEDIKYKFVPQIFTNVFVKACNDPNNQYYLVIEEINRGNCAEIFGDLFQLLDRNIDYPISTSRELTEYLNGSDENGDKIIKNSTLFWDENGKMLLPDNITLWATMNTSDQSLMPMDSAFKRRWEWEYIAINYSEKNNRSATFEIKIGKKSYSWLKFIEAVNKKISNIETLGMDKCLGNYFVDVPEGKIEISESIFKNKVLFYLWNDVFKDETDETIFKNANGQNKRTFADYFDEIKGSDYIIDLIEKELELSAINNKPKVTNSTSQQAIFEDNLESRDKSDNNQVSN